MILASKHQLVNYRASIRLWQHKFDTKSISDLLSVPEYLVAEWVSNFRDMSRGFA
jgi:hypothetical protein